MQKISALIHTWNHGRSIGRTLETLRACNEIVLIDHGSTDDTVQIARQYGARVYEATQQEATQGATAVCRYEWVLCLLANESLSEALEASLLEWKLEPAPTALAYSLNLREETTQGWQTLAPEVRLVPRSHMSWDGYLPVCGYAEGLSGDVLRFRNAS